MNVLEDLALCDLQSCTHVDRPENMLYKDGLLFCSHEHYELFKENALMRRMDIEDLIYGGLR